MSGTLTSSERGTDNLLPRNAARDLQDETPEHRVTLSHVGVSSTQRMILVNSGAHPPQPVLSRIRAGVQLDADRRGAHMSRFHEAIDSACADQAPHPLITAARIAAGIAHRQRTQQASAVISGELLLNDSSPISARPCHLPVHLEVGAACSNHHWRGTISISVAGMNACPCAQELVRDSSLERLQDAGYSERDAQRILTLIPGATHNQRGTATLTLGVEWSGSAANAPHAISIADQVVLARSSMGAEIHELLKRDDEHAVVRASHARPRFVEDCTRELIALCAADQRLDGDVHVWARQVNHESIHAHDVETLAHARLADIRNHTLTPLVTEPFSWLRAVE